jgi:hypothetical protein
VRVTTSVPAACPGVLQDLLLKVVWQPRLQVCWLESDRPALQISAAAEGRQLGNSLSFVPFGEARPGCLQLLLLLRLPLRLPMYMMQKTPTARGAPQPPQPDALLWQRGNCPWRRQTCAVGQHRGGMDGVAGAGHKEHPCCGGGNGRCFGLGAALPP